MYGIQNTNQDWTVAWAERVINNHLTLFKQKKAKSEDKSMSSSNGRPQWSRKVRAKQLRNASAPPSHFRKIHPQRSGHKSTAAQSRNGTTKKRKRATNDDDDGNDDDDAGKKRKNAYGGGGEVTGTNTGFLDVVDGFHAILSSTRAKGSSGSSTHAALADVFEWIGDAVIGEFVGRCLLSQFHHAPLSARVFRNLRLAVVTNRNLAQVYEKMGYQRRRYHHGVAGQQNQQQRGDPRKKLKEKADVVEAVVGELVVRLDRQSNDERACALYRGHLDALLATMLQTHFADRTRARQLGVCAGPLSVSFNPFSCLPEEELDVETGELVVLQGSFESEFDAAVHDPSREQELQEKSFADLIDEYKESESVGGIAITHSHHAFADAASDEAQSSPEAVPSSQQQVLTTRALAAMQQLKHDHVLRASKDVFEVFKVYGMTVLAERVSIALAQPHLLQHRGSAEQQQQQSQQKPSLNVTPAMLTRQRQRVLSVANLAYCSALLGVSSTQIFFDKVGQDEPEVDVQRLVEERLRANTLRAFIGFHSAIATTSAAANRQSSLLVNDICRFLQTQVFEESEHESQRAPTIPEREPLLSLMRSIGEAKVFMGSATCDALHLPGERPIPAASPASKTNMAFLLRQCDSDQVENLFETLAKEHEREKRRAQDREREAKQKKKAKNKKSKLETSGDGDAIQGHLAANLTRFQHRRFLFCLEEIVVLFAQRKTDECRRCIASFESELEPCAGSVCFRKWEVSTSTLTLAMRDSFYRLLLHDVCQFHEVVSSSKNTRDGTRITQLRLPMHYTWAKNVARRITTEQDATS